MKSKTPSPSTKSIDSLKSFSTNSIKSAKTFFTPQNASKFVALQISNILIAIFFNWLMISWIDKLDKNNCECSKDWKKPILQYWAYFVIVFSVIMFVLNIIFFFYYGLPISTIGIISLFSFINMIASLSYIYNLKKIDCKCSEDMRREIIYVWNWLKFALVLLIIFIIIILIMAGFGGMLKIKLDQLM